MFTMQSGEIAFTLQSGEFYRGEKKGECAKPCTKGRGMSYGKIGLTVAVTQNLPSGLSLVL